MNPNDKAKGVVAKNCAFVSASLYGRSYKQFYDTHPAAEFRSNSIENGKLEATQTTNET